LGFAVRRFCNKIFIYKAFYKMNKKPSKNQVGKNFHP